MQQKQQWAEGAGSQPQNEAFTYSRESSCHYSMSMCVSTMMKIYDYLLFYCNSLLSFSLWPHHDRLPQSNTVLSQSPSVYVSLLRGMRPEVTRRRNSTAVTQQPPLLLPPLWALSAISVYIKSQPLGLSTSEQSWRRNILLFLNLTVTQKEIPLGICKHKKITWREQRWGCGGLNIHRSSILIFSAKRK